MRESSEISPEDRNGRTHVADLDKIEGRRLELGWTKERLVKEVHDKHRTAHSTVKKVLEGKPVFLSSIAAVATTMGCTANDLLPGAPPPEPDEVWSITVNVPAAAFEEERDLPPIVQNLIRLAAMRDDVEVKFVQKRSVVIGLGLSKEDGRRLEDAFAAGRLKGIGVVDVIELVEERTRGKELPSPIEWDGIIHTAVLSNRGVVDVRPEEGDADGSEIDDDSDAGDDLGDDPLTFLAEFARETFRGITSRDRAALNPMERGLSNKPEWITICASLLWIRHSSIHHINLFAVCELKAFVIHYDAEPPEPVIRDMETSGYVRGAGYEWVKHLPFRFQPPLFLDQLSTYAERHEEILLFNQIVRIYDFNLSAVGSH